MPNDNAPKSLDPALPPSGLGFCAECACWLKGQATQVYALANGQAIPVDHPAAKDVPINQRRRLQVAPCTLFPQWTQTPSEMWCHQWRARP